MPSNVERQARVNLDNFSIRTIIIPMNPTYVTVAELALCAWIFFVLNMIMNTKGIVRAVIVWKVIPNLTGLVLLIDALKRIGWI